MTEQAHLELQAEAVAWHIRLRDGSAEDWEAFAEWLEGDLARSDAYDSVALADAALTAEDFPPALAPMAANDEWERPAARRRSPLLWATGIAALAAAILIAIISLPLLRDGPARYEVATEAGQRRTVPIGEGGAIMLNGGTRIVLDRHDARIAELVTGEAVFTVPHDSDRPFTVTMGHHQVQDVGTIFNLVREPGRLSVEVIEGAVRFDPAGLAIALEAGRTLTADDRGGNLVLGHRDPQAMASWRSGQLSYSAAPLRTVASELSRNLGTRIDLDPRVAAMPFTGSIRVDGDAAAAVTGLAATMGLAAHRTGHAWTIEPRSRARR